MERRTFFKNSSLATAGGLGLTILDFPIFGKNEPGYTVDVAIWGINNVIGFDHFGSLIR